MKNGAIKWDLSALGKLYKAMDQALIDTAKDVEQKILDAEVIPKKSGKLEASQNVVVRGDTIKLSYNSPYAARLYYHPEYEFSREQNRNAQGMWLNAVHIEDDIAEKYAKNLKGKI